MRALGPLQRVQALQINKYIKLHISQEWPVRCKLFTINVTANTSRQLPILLKKGLYVS